MRAQEIQTRKKRKSKKQDKEGGHEQREENLKER